MSARLNPSPPNLFQNKITAVILAGGQGRRMKGIDKGLMQFDGQPMVARLIKALHTQVKSILINANRNMDDYARFGVPVLADDFIGYQGPLAGMATALERIDTHWLLTTPCDVPEIPEDLAQRLWTAANSAQAQIAIAHDGQRQQPLHALIHRSTLNSLRRFLENGDRKTLLWQQQQRLIEVDYSDRADSFRNLNRASDFQPETRFVQNLN